MAKFIHAMVRVIDEARSVAFYKTAFGLEIADRFEFDNFILIYLRNDEADFELELTVNKGRSEPYDLGDGYGHLAVCVDDLDAEALPRRRYGAQEQLGVCCVVDRLIDLIAGLNGWPTCSGLLRNRET